MEDGGHAIEALARLESCKKTGVYALLKRIEAWEAQSGRDLEGVFDAAAGGGGENRRAREAVNV